jgi:hypothetical protein
MRCSWVEETLNAFLRVRWWIIESGMVYPVLGGVFYKREVFQDVPGDLFIKM